MAGAGQHTHAPTGATARRYSGKKLGCALGLLLPLAAASALFLWWMGKEPAGPILAVAGIDGESAAILRRGFEERGYVHVGVVDRDGDGRWFEPLFGVQDPPSIASAGGLVFVRVTEARGNAALHAFDAETGEFRWSGPPPPEPEPRPAFGAPALHASQEAIWELDGGPSPTVTVVDHQGELVERVDIPSGDGPRDAFLSEGDLLVNTGSAWMRVTPEGELRPGSPAQPPSRAMEAGEVCTPSIAMGIRWSCSESTVRARPQ